MKNDIAKGLIYAGILLQFFPFFVQINDDLSSTIHMCLVGVSAIGVLLLLLTDNEANEPTNKKGKKFKRELNDTEYMSITKEEIEALIQKENNEQGGN